MTVSDALMIIDPEGYFLRRIRMNFKFRVINE